MTTNLTRRGILKALGIGTLALAAEPILEPARKLWFVSSNAPVGSRIERVHPWEAAREIKKAMYAEMEREDLFREDLLHRLWTKVKSQEDLQVVRDAARVAESMYTQAEQQRLMDDYFAGLKAQKRVSALAEPIWKRLDDDYDLPPSATVVLA